MEIRDRIIMAGWETFFKYGVRSTTLDQLATELGISKKTIYQHFKDKNELVLAIVECAMTEERQRADEVFAISTDPIDEVLKATEVMREMMANISPTLLSDLEKYYPEAWSVFLESKKGFLVDIERNLKQGIEVGLYRAELNVTVLSRMRLECVEMALRKEMSLFGSFNTNDVNNAFLDHFIRGIVTEKGLERYSKYLNENNY